MPVRAAAACDLCRYYVFLMFVWHFPSSNTVLQTHLQLLRISLRDIRILSDGTGAHTHNNVNYGFLATNYTYMAVTNKVVREEKTGTTQASSLQFIMFILLNYSYLWLTLLSLMIWYKRKKGGIFVYEQYFSKLCRLLVHRWCFLLLYIWLIR